MPMHHAAAQAVLELMWLDAVQQLLEVFAEADASNPVLEQLQTCAPMSAPQPWSAVDLPPDD